MKTRSTILFDVLGNILVSKSEELYQKHINAEDFSLAAKFMVLRYLTQSASSAVRNVVLDNYFILEKMPDKVLYRWLVRNIPKQNSAFIRYIR